MIAEAARPHLAADGPGAEAAVAARVLLGETVDASELADAVVAETAETGRPEDRWLIRHVLLAAFLNRYDEMDNAAWGRCEQVVEQRVARGRVIEAWTDKPPPPAKMGEALLATLVVADEALVLARDVDLEMVDSVVGACLRVHPEGRLTPEDPERPIEASTFTDLVALHALADLALLRRDRSWAARVTEAAAWHQANT
ncbi:MAG: hypothetical protein R3336_05065, partial [Phycisphaeraceae bacterium]|nr:hypothetical protein [Phycisphaeraceae bacterium]